jgi:hypothetical protein
MFLPPEAAEWTEMQRNATGALYLTTGENEQQGAEASAPRPSLALTRPERNAVYRIAATLPITDQCIEVLAVPNALHAPLRVDLFVDDRLLASLHEGPYATLWQLEAGTHVFRARALDADANTWNSEPLQVTVMR